jgi:hypothetical protein
LILKNSFHLFFIHVKLRDWLVLWSLLSLFIYSTKGKSYFYYNMSLVFKALRLMWRKDSPRSFEEIQPFIKHNSSPIINKFIAFAIRTNRILSYHNLSKTTRMFDYLNNINLVPNNIHMVAPKVIKPYKFNLRFSPFFNFFKFNNLVL